MFGNLNLIQGGFVTPFMEDAGFELPHFCDFRVPGVTSISCDTHKYGFAPKGSSVIMYKSRELRKYQYFLQPNWTGGVYGSPTIAGSRPGALSAGCWAAMLHFGHSGYVNATKQMVSAARKIKKWYFFVIYNSIQSIDELELIGDPYLTVVAFKSKGNINIFSVSDVLSKKGYQLNVLQYPSAIHIACTMLTVPIVNDLVKDIKETINELKMNPSIASGSAAKIYGSAAAVPDRSIIGEVICGFLDGLTKI
jgi:sphinganine-1-phosphate aldolase